MLKQKLDKIYENIDLYFDENPTLRTDKEISNWVLDIEACEIKENEMLTYSIALMNVDEDKEICYKFTSVNEVLKQLFALPSKTVNVYIHNLAYDIKPFLIEFANSWGAKQNLDIIQKKEIYNPFKKKKEFVPFAETDKNDINKPKWSYDVALKKGILYQVKFYGELREDKRVMKSQQVCFRDTLKVMPFSLKKCASDFIDLDMSKEGLDYEKKRTLEDVLTKEEKKYIYEDVFALKHLVKKLIVDGFYINGREVRYYKLTNSSQSLYDYKLTLLEDYKLKQNIFADTKTFDVIDTLLMKTRFFRYDDKEKLQADILFKQVFPPLNYFFDSWLRHSYYGGLSMVDFDNVRKYEQYEEKIGQVFDVNSLYPYIMLDRLLPIGRPMYIPKPYKMMSKKYKSERPLYVQEITIHDFKLKEGKTPFVQVKKRSDFNGREVISENINKEGQKVTIKLILCNPLVELLFDNYDVKSYELGGHMSFEGRMGLFKNYLDFWGEVKKTSTGCNRAISKLRQNGLYGKFGSNPQSEQTLVKVVDNVWTTENTKEEFIDDNIYLPIATFITSWAKKYLVDSINKNRDKFLYCDTDSLHVFGKIEDIKGLNIDSKQYGAWKHELTFDDFKYLGAKRYAEKQIGTEHWDIKCCGLTNDIMKSIDDISVFDLCDYTPKELNKIKLYSKKDSIYYYKDKECTEKIKGLFKSKKSKIVKNGTKIQEQPYMISDNPFLH